MKTIGILSLFIAVTFHLKAQNIQEVHFLTKDSIRISASFELPKTKNTKVPVVILIHQGGSSREEWKALPLWNKLIKEGYAILAYDIRQHGKSGNDKGDIYDLFNNPKRAPLDVQAAIGFLQNDSRIDADRIGIIGASIGANLACVAAASDAYPIKTAVSLSAKTSAVQNLSGQKTPLRLRNVFYIASKDEQNGKRKLWAEELLSKTTGAKKIEIANGNKHGSFILRESKTTEDAIVNWIKKTL